MRSLISNFAINDLASLDLSTLYYALSEREAPKRRGYSGSDIQHALLEHLIDENIQDFLTIWTGKPLNDEEEIFVFNEPRFENQHCPDRIYVWPKVGIFLVDVFQRRKSSRIRGTHKSKQFRSHVNGITNLIKEIYGDQANLTIVPIFIKFRLDDETKLLMIRPLLNDTNGFREDVDEAA